MAGKWAFLGHHESVELLSWMRYSDIGEGYAMAGNDGKVEKYRIEHGPYHPFKGSVENSIAHGYAVARNDKKVKEYELKSDLRYAKKILKRDGKVGESIQRAIDRLKEDQIFCIKI